MYVKQQTELQMARIIGSAISNAVARQPVCEMSAAPYAVIARPHLLGREELVDQAIHYILQEDHP